MIRDLLENCITELDSLLVETGLVRTLRLEMGREGE